MPDQMVSPSAWYDRSTRTGLVISLMMTILEWSLVGVFYWRLSPEVPLFYSQPLGVAQLAAKQWFLLVPSLGTVFTGLVWIVLRLSMRLQPIFWQIVVWLLTLTHLLALTAMVHTLLLVF